MKVMTRPQIFGTGLICLDLIKPVEDFPHVSLGGSCGNVLMILSNFGWQTIPLARIGNDEAGRHILKELLKQSVPTDFIFIDSTSTPIIVEQLQTSNSHSFLLNCSNCKFKFGTSRLLTDQMIRNVLDEGLTKFVELPYGGSLYFYLDRLSRGLLELVMRMKRDYNATIVFEPQNLSLLEKFPEMHNYVDILKYSLSKRTKWISPPLDIPVVIRTEGENGSMIWINGDPERIAAYHVESFVDAAGAGDWTTAGFLYHIGERGLQSKKRIIEAMQFGHALASIKCSYVGPRTVLDVYSIDELKMIAYEIMEGQDISMRNGQLRNPDPNYAAKDIVCPKCHSIIV